MATKSIVTIQTAKTGNCILSCSSVWGRIKKGFGMSSGKVARSPVSFGYKQGVRELCVIGSLHIWNRTHIVCGCILQQRPLMKWMPIWCYNRLKRHCMLIMVKGRRSRRNSWKQPSWWLPAGVCGQRITCDARWARGVDPLAKR